MRTAAEFDNYKKRTEREKSGIAEYARAGIIKQLLPIIDNIERAAAADKESPDYLKGIEMIIKQFEALSEKLQIDEIAKPGVKTILMTNPTLQFDGDIRQHINGKTHLMAYYREHFIKL